MSRGSLVVLLAWVVAMVAVGRPARRPRRIGGLATPAGRRSNEHRAAAEPFDGAHADPASPPSRGVARLGAAVRRLARRPPDAVADRRLGRALAVAVLVPLGLPAPVAVAFAVGLWCRPVLVARRERRRRDQALVDELPDAVDLLRLAIQSGGNARLAVTAVADRLEGEVGDHLRSVCRRVAHGDRLADAVAVLRSVEPLRPVADAVIDAERYGVALGPSLDRLAAEARSRRRRQAEERARRVPVAMLFPLVGCVLPSFALLTVVPLFAGTLRTLHL